MKVYDNAVVIGLGASGRAAAELLAREGVYVRVIDCADEAKVASGAAALRAVGVEVITGCETLDTRDFQVCVVSPGVRADSAWVTHYRNAGADIISELELGWSRVKCRTLAVTGSNGKSTLCKLCAELLTCSGLNVRLCGNYGTPVSAVAMDDSNADWLVMEVSSFQLECVKAFRPDVGVLLNVFPNHLERHGGMDEYVGMKKRIFTNMRENDTSIVNEENLGLLDTDKIFHRNIVFGKTDVSDFRYEPGRVIFEKGADAHSVMLSRTVFDNPVLGVTAAAAVAAATACGADCKCYAAAFEAFKPLEHRIEFVAEKNGVKFIDDSKATNLAATSAALMVCSGKVRLIAGGRAKGESFFSIKSLLAQRVSAVYLIGESADEMLDAWADAVPCFLCGALKVALEKAWRDARSGDVILLSPGCASFDQFKGFEERGRVFRDMAQKLA